MRIYVPGPQPMTRREATWRALSFILRCAAAVVGGIGAACIILAFAAAATVIGDAVIVAILP